MADPAIARTDDQLGPPLAVQPGSIVVVDDDEVHARSIADLLQAHGYVAETCNDGAAGIERVLADPPNVLILDLNMPGKTGLDVLSELGEHQLITKTIVLTGESSLSTVSPVVRLGAFEYMAKPPNPNALMSSVRQALNLSAAEQRSRSLARSAEHSNRLHRFLVDAIPDLIYMLDKDGNISFINSKLERVFGFDAKTLQGRPWADLFANSQRSTELAKLFQNRFNERRTNQRATQQYEFDYVAANHETFRLEFSATGLYDADDDGYSGTYGVLRDITAKHHAEQDRLDLQAQIQQASKMEAIGQLAGGIAHDFNNILASIIGYAELVQTMRLRLQDEEVNEYLGEVVSAGHRARDLISQMLTFTRARRGEPQPVQLVSTISDVSRMLRAAIPTTIEIITDYQDALPQVVADPVQLQQVVLNLLINARDAISGNGVIEIGVALGDQPQRCITCGEVLDDVHVVLSVADTGHGIPKDLQDKIFDMYYTTRAPGQGTGIGLWLINDLIHEYGGHITVQSNVAEGTQFRVHLPPAPVDEALHQANEPSKADVAGRIVVVDDEVSVSSFIGEVLRDKGYEAAIYNDSTQALVHITEQIDNIGMLITDQRMPRLTGMELITRVREMRQDLPIILVTGFVKDTKREDLQQAGVNGLLNKPFRIEELLASIARHARSE